MGFILLLLIAGLLVALNPNFDPLASFRSLVTQNTSWMLDGILYTVAAGFVYVAWKSIRYRVHGRQTLPRKSPF